MRPFDSERRQGGRSELWPKARRPGRAGGPVPHGAAVPQHRERGPAAPAERGRSRRQAAEGLPRRWGRGRFLMCAPWWLAGGPFTTDRWCGLLLYRGPAQPMPRRARL